MPNTPSDAEIEKLAAEHLKAFAQFTGAGDVWVEGEVAFARAVLAKWGSPQPVVRGHHPPRPLQQLLALFAQGSALALLQLPGAAAHAAAVAGHVLVGVVFHLAPSAGFAATGAVQINSAARSRTS